MKIALIRQKYNPAGGAERFVSRALEALSATGADVTLFARKWESSSAFTTIKIDPFYIGSTWRDLGFASAIRKQLQHYEFDLVQSHERIPGVNLYRAGDGVHRAWLRHRSKIISPLRHWFTKLSPYHRYVCAAEKRMFLHPNLKAVICISKLVKAEIQEYFQLPDEKLPVIYLGVDTDYFHPDVRLHRMSFRQQNQTPQDARVLLFVGSGFERKGLATILRSMRFLPENTYLWVVGKDKKLAKFQQMAERIGVAARVRFCGTFQDVRPFYGGADVFVMPAVYEPFGNVNMEAMACGLPILTSKSAGAADLVLEGKTGWIIDAQDDKMLASHISGQSAESLLAMGNAARLVATNYSIGHMVDALTQLYQTLLHDPAAS